ncbi:MAG: hypothetical protein WB987_18170 [Candidatus Acidiferrales bacterium]
MKLMTQLHVAEARCHLLGSDPKRSMTIHDYSNVYSIVGSLAADCVTHGLSSSAQKCGRIHESMEAKRMATKYEECGNWLKELRERLEDDFHSHLFLQLSGNDAELYNHPRKGWEDVIRRFPKTANDIEESSKCFALNRYAASLFHILLVAEYGVIEVARLFGVAGDKPGWGATDRLQRVHDKKWNEKTPLEQKHSELLGKILPLMHSIKNEWRHKINHVDNKLEWIDTDFSPEVTGRIISASLGFMIFLSAELPKETNEKKPKI